jgi:hypothetical protein
MRPLVSVLSGIIAVNMAVAVAIGVGLSVAVNVGAIV